MHVITPDFRVDISLHVLSLVVASAIALALIWQLVVILNPLAQQNAATPVPFVHLDEEGPPAWAAMGELQEPPREPAAVPGRTAIAVFRCEAGGSVTYTDRPCDHGVSRVLHLRPN